MMQTIFDESGDFKPIWQVFPHSIPHRPYCTDAPDMGLLIRPRETALGFSHIQINEPGRLRWLPFDVDLPDAFEAYERADLPAPNVFVSNPENGHAHIAWAVERPVFTGSNARTAPIKYAEAIQRGMGRRMGADPAYSGLITKNPLHGRWRTRWLAPRPYSLDDLAGRLTSADMRFKPKTIAEMGFIGRNVQVFNEVRAIAYREVRTFKRNGATIELFRERLERIAAGVNLEFASPLTPRELRSTARSIAKWVWPRFSENRFSEIQSARGVKSGAARREKQAQVRSEIAAYIARLQSEPPREVLLSDMVHRHPLCNVSAIARALNLPRKTVSDHLAAIREATS